MLNSNLCFELYGTPKLQQKVPKPPKVQAPKEVKKEMQIPVKQVKDTSKIDEHNKKLIEEKTKRQ